MHLVHEPDNVLFVVVDFTFLVLVHNALHSHLLFHGLLGELDLGVEIVELSQHFGPAHTNGFLSQVDTLES